MKIFLCMAFAVLLLGLVSCVNANGDDDVWDISGPGFSAHVQDIRMNRDEYLGRTIRYEGMFLSSFWELTGETIYMIADVGDDCCGIPGFEVYLNDLLPVEDGTWVEVTGVLEEFFAEDVGGYILRVSVISMARL